MFKSLIEIRFIAKSFGLELPKQVFNDNLAKMAACVRLLRLGDGEISGHSGNDKHINLIQNPSRQMIDAALSVVELKNINISTIPGFTRLSTKKVILIINTKPSCAMSYFNSPTKQGINIFNFESSFGLNRLINHADISILSNKLRVKVGNKAEYISETDHEKDCLRFAGEVQQRNPHFTFNLRREIVVDLNREKITGTDTIRASAPFQASVRFVFAKQATIKEINSKSFSVNIETSEYIVTVVKSNQDCCIFAIKDENYQRISNTIGMNSKHHPSVEIYCPQSEGSGETKIIWSIARL
jgi:hypothetical protein